MQQDTPSPLFPAVRRLYSIHRTVSARSTRGDPASTLDVRCVHRSGLLRYPRRPSVNSTPIAAASVSSCRILAMSGYVRHSGSKSPGTSSFISLRSPVLLSISKSITFCKTPCFETVQEHPEVLVSVLPKIISTVAEPSLSDTSVTLNVVK